MPDLWGKNDEQRFFEEALASGVPADVLFYKTDAGRMVAYWEKNYIAEKGTLQSRNSHIGKFTEIWVKDLLSGIAKENNAHAVSGVVCEKLALPKNSNADVAICATSQTLQTPENILMIIEVKMSIVWNWEYDMKTGKVFCIGDYNSHTGNPGLLRSDSMLKAIGKSMNIRIADDASRRIPIIVLGNTPITENYRSKVDRLKQTGIIQGFWSVNPNPTDNGDKKDIGKTQQLGFMKFNNYKELNKMCKKILSQQQEFFSGMLNKKELGKIIEHANNESSVEDKAEKFLELLKGQGNE